MRSSVEATGALLEIINQDALSIARGCGISILRIDYSIKVRISIFRQRSAGEQSDFYRHAYLSVSNNPTNNESKQRYSLGVAKGTISVGMTPEDGDGAEQREPEKDELNYEML